MKKTKNKANKAWFRYTRRSYLPATWQGLYIYIAYVAYSVAVPVAWYNRGHNLWELLTNVIPLLVLGTIVTQFVASKNAK
jgi:hypothetical protein